MPSLGKAPTQELSRLDWTNLRCDLIWIYDDTVESNHLSLKEFMPGQSALLIHKGDVTISTEAGEIAAGPGKWVFLNEGRRMQKFSANSHILSIRFHCAWPGRQPLFDWDVAGIVDSEEFPGLELSAQRLKESVEKKFPLARLELRNAFSDVGHYLEVQHLFIQWLQHYVKALQDSGCVLSRCEIGDPRVLRAIRIIEHHPLDLPFREVEFARQVGLSASRLGKLFNQKFGISPCHYFERRRFEEAIARVRTTSSPLKSIAVDLGFSSLPHFSSWFRRKARISPSDLRSTVEIRSFTIDQKITSPRAIPPRG